MMTLTTLKAMTVDRFPGSRTRGAIWSSFVNLYTEILAADFPCQIWIDGSFVTDEEDPADIDFSIHVDASLMATPTNEMRAILDRFDDGANPGELDGFVCTTYPREHPRFGTQEDDCGEWALQWCVSRQNWLKGIAVLRPGETDVGLRICS